MRCASGPSITACHFLLYRFDFRYGFKPDMGESWICQKVGTTIHALRGQLGWYTGLWRSPAGKVYVSCSFGHVLVNPDPEPRAAPWREDPVPGTLTGIWGIDDECVFTWGVRGGAPVLYRFEGRKWTELPVPGEISAMHGVAPDLVLAAEKGNLVSCWDGSRWTKLAIPGDSVPMDLLMVSKDEMVAVTSDGRLLRGPLHGLVEVLNGAGPLYAVAKWKGEVWVAAEAAGLLKLSGSMLVPVKPNIKATALDARGDLLVSSRTAVAGTTDGAAYFGVDAARAGRAIGHLPAAWMKP
jgi:hypothetical protein